MTMEEEDPYKTEGATGNESDMGDFKGGKKIWLGPLQGQTNTTHFGLTLQAVQFIQNILLPTKLTVFTDQCINRSNITVCTNEPIPNNIISNINVYITETLKADHVESHQYNRNEEYRTRFLIH